MKLFFDTEFREDGVVIDLISIGLVKEDGSTYYAISAEFDLQKALAHPFLAKEVMPHLDSADLWKPRSQIAQEVKEFAGKDPEFWASWCSYDWVCLCQLFGTMLDIPDTWPYFCRDIQQLKDKYPGIILPQPDNEHNALSDALNVRDCYYLLKNIDK